MTWGSLKMGGDSSKVRNELRNVQHISATEWAFAAILVDGSVVTCGAPEHGGDSSGVQGQLRNVQKIYAANGACSDVFCSFRGANLKGMPRMRQDVLANREAFVAMANGIVVTWSGGGKISHPSRRTKSKYPARISEYSTRISEYLDVCQ